MKFVDSQELIRKAEYTSIYRIRELVLNIFNPNEFSSVDMQGIIRNSDKEHLELFEDIIDMSKDSRYFEVAKFGEKLAREIYENK